MTRENDESEKNKLARASETTQLQALILLQQQLRKTRLLFRGGNCRVPKREDVFDMTTIVLEGESG